ncbi:ATP-binding protein [Selenomonas dianae]|uniref:IstB-like ATP-binding domain-containing protein n=1 Tax=Selenomonas dianae TaxID=135079 RepID=A0ABP3CTJ2_9FIRM|nr:ATP-binding protein [Selenomonas dianae]WLD83532.1 ATP-binding protein [Selenomonas dianae]
MDIERAQERCKGCTGEVCKQPSQGMIPVVEVHDGRFCHALRRCRHERNRLARLRISRLFASARIPRAYEGDTFADYTVTATNKDAVDAAHMMVADEIKGLFLHGEKGTGKTKLAAIIANERARAGSPVLFASVPDLMADIRRSFKDGTTSEAVQAVKNAPFLVLDDLGAEKMTEWVGEQLFCIVNHRYNECLQTVVTSNYSPTQVIAHMATVDRDGNVIDDMQGQRIMSRIYEMCERVEIRGKDYRMKGAC